MYNELKLDNTELLKGCGTPIASLDTFWYANDGQWGTYRSHGRELNTLASKVRERAKCGDTLKKHGLGHIDRPLGQYICNDCLLRLGYLW